METLYRINEHAALRMSQRNLSVEEIEFVIEHGRAYHRRGATFYFLGKRDIPAKLRREIWHLNGAIVVVDEEDVVTTAYRNPNGLHKIKRKTKIKERRKSYKKIINLKPKRRH